MLFGSSRKQIRVNEQGGPGNQVHNKETTNGYRRWALRCPMLKPCIAACALGKEHGPIINGLGSQSQINESGSWLVTLLYQWLFSLEVS